jgi:hypothetical protein
MKFTNHHPEPNTNNKKFKPNCCCHDYPGHFSSVDCNSKELKACNFVFSCASKTCMNNNCNRIKNTHSNYHDNYSHDTKPCNCK